MITRYDMVATCYDLKYKEETGRLVEWKDLVAYLNELQEKLDSEMVTAAEEDNICYEIATEHIQDLLGPLYREGEGKG